ncbi:MAG: hypothetical protein OEU36_10185 [Gammaproteobacteria bacterium]|nr:hypothetical protein [Gammaproteobacteria bacterium]
MGTLGRAITLALGAILSLVGLWGTSAAIRLTSFVWSNLSTERYVFTPATVIYQGLWVVVALCVLATGISLIVSGWKRKRHNLIPGPTLYILGFILGAIGVFLFMFNQVPFAIGTFIAGLLLIYSEWAFRIT